MIRSIGIAVLMLTVHGALCAADFVLVDEGLTPAPIVVFADAPPRTREAAVTLADYIEKICGRRPEVIEGEPQPLPERAIWVGVQPTVTRLFPKLNVNFQHPEEILLAADERHLLIAGRDRWDPERLDVEGGDGKITGKQQEYGTANAVFTFLQDKLDVRWLWPGELGEDVPRQRAIRIAPFEYRYHPRIRSRAGVLHFSTLGERGYGRSHEWLKLQRLQLHSIDMGGGHGFGTWWDRFHEEHPEYFALQPDGIRSGFPGPHDAKLCMSNPAVWRQWLADVEATLAKDPTQTIFNASPNDSWASGHCVCDNCRAWDHPDGEPRMFHWKGRRELHPALTDRDITFANRLGELLKQRFPDKDYYVLMMSYGHSRPKPVRARPAENVIISSVANFLGRTTLVDDGSTRGTTHRQQFEDWTKIAPHLMWRPNTGSPAGWQQGLPDVSIAQTIEDFKLVGNSGCLGIFIDSVWEHWATQGPQYYLMAQLTWDASRDGTAILDDYYRRGFGPAAGPVRDYFETFERARMRFVGEQGYEGGIANLARLYTPELLDEAAGHLLKAESAVGSDENEVYLRRVEFLAVGLNFTELVAENARLMDRYWQQSDEGAKGKVLKNWQAIEELCKANPHAINWGPVRPTTTRMLGLHPDYPNPKLKKTKPVPSANDLDLN